MAWLDIPGRDKNIRLEGKLIDEAKVEDPEACPGLCKSDPMCLALEDIGGQICRRFSEVTGLREASADEGSASIMIKKQQ
jgi:hypothetical protein